MRVRSLYILGSVEDTHTLGVQVVADRDRVRAVAFVSTDRSVTEHLIDVLRGTDAHILLTERLDMLVDVCVLLSSN